MRTPHVEQDYSTTEKWRAMQDISKILASVQILDVDGVRCVTYFSKATRLGIWNRTPRTSKLPLSVGAESAKMTRTLSKWKSCLVRDLQFVPHLPLIVNPSLGPTVYAGARLKVLQADIPQPGAPQGAYLRVQNWVPVEKKQAGRYDDPWSSIPSAYGPDRSKPSNLEPGRTAPYAQTNPPQATR